MPARNCNQGCEKVIRFKETDEDTTTRVDLCVKRNRQLLTLTAVSRAAPHRTVRSPAHLVLVSSSRPSCPRHRTNHARHSRPGSSPRLLSAVPRRLLCRVRCGAYRRTPGRAPARTGTRPIDASRRRWPWERVPSRVVASARCRLYRVSRPAGACAVGV